MTNPIIAILAVAHLPPVNMAAVPVRGKCAEDATPWPRESSHHMAKRHVVSNAGFIL
jgi:hypothetical protein